MGNRGCRWSAMSRLCGGASNAVHDHDDSEYDSCWQNRSKSDKYRPLSLTLRSAAVKSVIHSKMWKNFVISFRVWGSVFRIFALFGTSSPSALLLRSWDAARSSPDASPNLGAEWQHARPVPRSVRPRPRWSGRSGGLRQTAYIARHRPRPSRRIRSNILNIFFSAVVLISEHNEHDSVQKRTTWLLVRES